MCVRRVNVSLDHLNNDRFREITRWGDLSKVLNGINKAKAGLNIKINTVALKNFNENHLLDILNWCSDNDHDLTFIEVTPMGDIGTENRFHQYLLLSTVRKFRENVHFN